MFSLIRPAIVLFVVLSLLTGVAYPLAVTAVAQLAFPNQAGGSMIADEEGRAVGSSLVGQDFSAGDPGQSARWFWGRPSATGPVPYTALDLKKGTGSSGSNLATTNPALTDNVRSRVEALAAADAAAGIRRSQDGRIPIDLVTSSGSGLDPHISPAAAEYQVPRIARVRGMREQAVRESVARHTRNRSMRVLGEPVVNVLELNLDLEHANR